MSGTVLGPWDRTVNKIKPLYSGWQGHVRSFRVSIGREQPRSSPGLFPESLGYPLCGDSHWLLSVIGEKEPVERL